MELLLTTIIIFTIFIITLLIPIDNKALEVLVSSIPVIIPTLIMWARMPKNYLKFMIIKSVNIKYQIDIKIEECTLSKKHFLESRQNLLKLDQTNKGRILKSSFGEEIMLSLLEIDTAVVELQYYQNSQTLYIKTNSNIKYKLFFQIAKKLLAEINSIFTSNKELYYNKKNIMAKIRIEFIDNIENTDACKIHSSNPFWKELFHGFKNKLVDFKYETKNGNSVLITNDIIEFIGSDIESISKDIQKELTLFTIKN